MNSIFRALNDETRRAILDLLKEQDLTAGDIASYFEMTKPSISHHLDVLKQADLVSCIKQGQFVIYSLNTTLLDEVIQWFMDLK